MRLSTTALVLVLLAGAGVAAAGDPPARPARPERFTLLRDYLVLARVSVAHLHGLSFIVDTGTTRTIIDRRLAKRLKEQLKLGSSEARMAAFSTSVTVTDGAVSDIQLGSKRFLEVPVLVMDLRPLTRPLGERIDGVLGMDLLGRQKLEVDYRARTLSLEDCTPTESRVAFEATPDLPVVKVEIEGRPVRLIVDTGASAMQLYADSNTAPVKRVSRQAVGYAGAIQVSEATLPTARLGESELTNTRVFVVEEHPQELSEIGGSLSPSALAFHRICLDVPKNEFSWSRSD